MIEKKKDQDGMEEDRGSSGEQVLASLIIGKLEKLV